MHYKAYFNVILFNYTKNGEEEYRPRNVAKLLFINMLGHNTDFG